MNVLQKETIKKILEVSLYDTSEKGLQYCKNLFDELRYDMKGRINCF